MIQMTAAMLRQAAINLCQMRGVEPSESPGEGEPQWIEIAQAEIAAALQIQNAVMLAARNCDATGQPIKPTILNANGGRLN